MDTPTGQAPNGQDNSHIVATPANPTGVSREEHERLLAQARREEKDKLYPELENIRKKMTKLEQEKSDLQAAIESAQTESRSSKKLESRLAEVEEQLGALPERFSKVMEDSLEELKREGETARQRDLLAATRERLVNSTSELIPEMVTGNSPEELQANYEKAKQRYKEIYDQSAEKTRKEMEDTVRGALPQPVTATGANNNAGGQPDADAAGGLDDWRRMAPSEWEAKKKAIKEDAFRKAGLSMKQR